MGWMFKDTKEEKKVPPTKKIIFSDNSKQATNLAEFPTANGNGNGGVAQPEYLDYFKKVFVERNFPGPDYQEFMNAVNMLKDQPVTEQMKFFSAYSGLSVQGVTKKTLVDTAKKYIVLFDEKRQGFEKALLDETATNVDSKRQQAETIKKENEKLNKQMADINQKINENAESIKKLGAEADTAQGALTHKRDNFEASYNVMVGEINENIAKIEQHIPNPTTATK